jgi:hypothetical protein
MSATTRLPNPGGDSGNWGTILNDFVSQSTVASTTANPDNGLLKPDHAAITQGGKVGIGISTPTAKLHVQGDVNLIGTETGTSFNFGGNEDVFIRAGKLAGNVYIADHAGAKNTILNSSTGNVGIGNGNPNTKLAVNGDVSLAGSSANSYNSHFNIGVNEETYIRSGIAGGNVYIAEYPGAGNVGIGGTPGTKFHVYGTTTFTGTGAGSQNSHFHYGPNEDVYMRSGQQQGVVRIQDTPGNVMIGSGNPTSKLHIIGLQTFPDNATAIAGGLTQGAVYQHPSGELRIVV